MYAAELHAIGPVRDSDLQRLDSRSRSQIIAWRTWLNEKLSRIRCHVSQSPVLAVQSVGEQDSFGSVSAEAQSDAFCLEAEFQTRCSPPGDVLLIPAAFVRELLR
jgi:hypothetical protein